MTTNPDTKGRYLGKIAEFARFGSTVYSVSKVWEQGQEHKAQYKVIVEAAGCPKRWYPSTSRSKALTLITDLYMDEAKLAFLLEFPIAPEDEEVA